MTMGKGAVISLSNIMKCNTRSSTETELISVHDKLPDITWTRYFVECQGYDIDEYIVSKITHELIIIRKEWKNIILEADEAHQGKVFLDQGLLRFWRN